MPQRSLAVSPAEVIDVDSLPENPSKTSLPPKSTSKWILPPPPPRKPDVTGPNPDVHALFSHYNEKHFSSKLTNVYVEFSTRMTLCAGTCTYRGPVGGCRIALSEPLLKLRPSSDLRSTLLHEMIHAHLFNKGISRDGPDGHGPLFMDMANRINAVEPSDIRITPYHTFNSEVEHYRTHHWKCSSCAMLIKRAMNRKPGPYDIFWEKHKHNCGGTFVKIREPPKKEKPPSAPKRRAIAVDKKASREKRETEAVPKGVMLTFRIDDMLGSKPDQSTTVHVDCPVCGVAVSKQSLNRHLDQCLSADFTNDVIEVDVTQAPNVTKGKENYPSPILAKPPKRSATPSHVDLTHSEPSLRILDNKQPSVSRGTTRVSIPSSEDTVEPDHRKTIPRARNQRASIVSATNPRGKGDSVTQESYINFAINPRAFDAKKTRQLVDFLEPIEVKPPVAKKPKKSFAEILSPVMQGEKAIECDRLEKTGIRPLKMKTVADDDLSFVSIARRLGVAHTDVFQTLRDKCRVDSDGCLVVPDDFENIVMSAKRGSGLVDVNRPDSVRRQARGTNAVSAVREQPDIAMPTKRGSGHVDANHPDNSLRRTREASAASLVREKQSRGEKIGNCPVCDKLVLRSQLEAHVNECLDGSNLKDVFFSQNSREHEQAKDSASGAGRNAGESSSDVPGSANCPICNSVIMRPQLEAHVNACLMSAGLDDAF